MGEETPVATAADAVRSFGAVLRGHREAAGLSQAALAERARVSARAVSALERGVNRAPHPGTLARLAAALGLAPHQRAALQAAARGAAPGQARRPTNLPLPLTSFVGRERELAALAAQLGAHRLVTLTGPGGVGKTRLALRTASETTAGFADGVAFVDLAPVGNAGLVPATLAHALGVRETAGRGLPERLAEHLRRRCLLLVLDNCEHLLDGVAPLVAALLGACPRVRVLATSRAPLRVSGEHEFAVSPLGLPEPDAAAPERLAAAEAVRLFVARARAVRPDFALTPETAAAVAHVCVRLDGLPLAIELAAARSRAFSPPALRARLERRLPLLAGGPRDAPARQRTLRDAIGWSYALLPPAEQLLFRRLGVFAGGCTPEGAAAVAGEDGDPAGVPDGLLALTEQSLLRAADGPGGETRFVLLETVREFALERLDETPEADAVRERHAAYCVAFAERAAGARNTPGDAAALPRLEAEHANLRAALEWALQRGAAETALRLAGALGSFWQYTGRAAEGRAWLARALALPRDDTPVGRAAAAQAVRAAAGIAYNQGDHAAAGPLMDEALALARAAGDTPQIIGQLQMRAMLARRLGAPAVARALLEESVALARRAGAGVTVGYGLARLGVLALDRGDAGAARQHLGAALAAGRAAGVTRLSAFALLGLGRVALGEHDPAAARGPLAESLALYRELGDPIYLALHLEAWGHAAALEGRPRGALRLAGAAAAVRARAGIAPPPHAQRRVEAWVTRARRAAGPGPATAAWADGQAMALDAALDAALEPPGPGPEAEPPGRTDTAPGAAGPLEGLRPGPGARLTPREREVAALVAEGLTSREIARRLIITEGTARIHVERLRAKLGLRSRAHIAAWVVAHQAPPPPAPAPAPRRASEGPP